MKNKKILFLFVYVLLACLFVYIFKPIYIISILIVLGVPSAINFFWLKKSRNKILAFSLLTTLIFAPTVELVSMLANDWDVATVFPKILGYIPVENMLFAFLNFFWVLSFYEYFTDKDKTRNISPHFKVLAAIFSITAFIVFSLFFYDKGLVTMSYWKVSIPTLIIPSIIIFSYHPKLLKKTILTMVFFALVFFIYEIVSMSIGSWWWPGEYLWTVKVFGKIFPMDDVVIWYILSTPALIGGYEFFVDDTR
jgi:hypothetical protein